MYDAAYLILEVIDIGNSNLTEGAKIEVSTKTNSTQIIVTTDDELGDNEVSVHLYSIKDGDEVFIGTVVERVIFSEGVTIQSHANL